MIFKTAVLIAWVSKYVHSVPFFSSGWCFRDIACLNFTQIFIIYKTLAFFCFSTSKLRVQKLCKSNRVWNESTKGALCWWMASVHHDSQLKLHASTKTYPPGLALFCPKAPWPTSVLFSDLRFTWDRKASRSLAWLTADDVCVLL